MDLEPSGKGRAAVQIAGVVAAMLLWGFGFQYVLQNYVFVSPPAIYVQHTN
jgi:hypothetical protein